jgi:hypothetical protein
LEIPFERYTSAGILAGELAHGRLATPERFERGLRYSDLFWALPDKGVYMAVGRNGQVIMVFSNLDVVAITTGRENYRLGELADSISRSVKSDLVLPVDSAGAKLLANKILDVSTGKAH